MSARISHKLSPKGKQSNCQTSSLLKFPFLIDQHKQHVNSTIKILNNSDFSGVRGCGGRSKAARRNWRRK